MKMALKKTPKKPPERNPTLKQTKPPKKPLSKAVENHQKINGIRNYFEKLISRGDQEH